MNKSFLSIARNEKELQKKLLMRTQKLQEAEKRIQNFDRIIQKIYEDKVCGDLMEE